MIYTHIMIAVHICIRAMYTYTEQVRSNSDYSPTL